MTAVWGELLREVLPVALTCCCRETERSLENSASHSFRPPRSRQRARLRLLAQGRRVSRQKPANRDDWCFFVSTAAAVFFWILLIPSILLAQSPSLAVGSVTIAAGAPVDLPVNLTAGATPVSTLQFDLTLPSSLPYVSVTAVSAAAVAGKSAQANGTSNGIRVLVFGLNQAAIGSGPLVTVRLNVGSGVAGIFRVGISGIVASDPGGVSISVSGIDGSVTVGTSSTINFTQITVSGFSNDSVTINWNTDKLTTGSVEYGTTSVTQLNGQDLNLTTDHRTRLTGLTPSTVYFYRVTARDTDLPPKLGPLRK